MIVITGAGGFIGSNILYHLNQKGLKRIILCDENFKKNNINKREYLKIVKPNKLIDYMETKTKIIHAVIHMGANSSTTEKNLKKIYSQNTRFSKNLWNWCSKNKVRLIYASSAAIYGDGQSGFDDTDPICNFKPLNYYGWTKYFFDRYAINQANKDHSPPQWVGLRFFNVYGPNEYHKGQMQSVVAHSYNQYTKEGEVKLFKSHNKNYKHGHQKRDFIAVSDCVSVILWILENPKISGIFNCGTGEARTFKDLVLAMYTSLKTEPKIIYVNMPENIKKQYQYYTKAEMKKIKKAGYKNKFIKLEEGVRDYVTKYLSINSQHRHK